MQQDIATERRRGGARAARPHHGAGAQRRAGGPPAGWSCFGKTAPVAMSDSDRAAVLCPGFGAMWGVVACDDLVRRVTPRSKSPYGHTRSGTRCDQVGSRNRMPSSGGIAPVSWLSLRSSPTVRPLPSVVTPYHSPTGLPVSQPSRRAQLVPRWRCRARPVRPGLLRSRPVMPSPAASRSPMRTHDARGASYQESAHPPSRGTCRLDSVIRQTRPAVGGRTGRP